MKVLLPADTDYVGACALDFGAHAVEKVGQVYNMRLFCGIINNGGTFGLGSGQHHVNGAAYGYHIKKHISAGQRIAAGVDHATAFLGLRAQAHKSL